MILRQSRFKVRARRGAGIAAVVVMLAILNLVIIGSIAPAADEASTQALRVDTIRAIYAADSGGIVLAKLAAVGGTPPTAGSTVSLTGATIKYTQVPAAGQPGTATIVGSSGSASRRVRVVLQSP
jgi:hypothetical protein